MSFVADLSKFKHNSVTKVNAMRDAVVLAVFRGTILATPVLTGRLRANWQFSRVEPVREATDEVDTTGAQTIAKITSELRGKNVNNERVFLSNNLPYAYRIEYDGHSSVKAPNGMVRVTMRRVIENLRKQQLEQ